MSKLTPDIAMCWTGTTETAELHIDGRVLTGAPRDVQRAFDTLNELREQRNRANGRLANVARMLEQATQEVKGSEEK